MSNKITIPFCYLPNSKAQVFDLETTYRSKFQIEQLKAVSERDDFAFFTTLLHERSEWIAYDREASCKCPVTIMWYDKYGQCYAARVGMKKFMDGLTTWRKVGSGNKPDPIDHVIYTSRCK
jgi:hypothetical protein